ncbi:hypothetical protein GCM10009868_38300 [Terrabacter aerolatus]|uniref:DUF202 domain-containing protein n=1 Tax=Terrabacter aerolatus TaxID=422442 RepID=A0A512D0P2_9MICO|nr:DUF202 domain-containing protein [Terrabacter aerolatus]GEO30037.1 hypothetical protein TAE01_18470 [Terrabacter aerolatus]
MTAPQPSGMQAERTSLAWRRTSLSVAVGSLVGLRVLPPHLGPTGYAVSVLGLLWSLDLALSARRRYRDGQRLLRTSSGATTAGPKTGPRMGPTIGTTAGATVARTALTSGTFALTALVALVVIARR